MRHDWDREGLAAAADLMGRMVIGDVDSYDRYYAEDRKKRRALAALRGEGVPLEAVVASTPSKHIVPVAEPTITKKEAAPAPGRFPPPPTGASR